jgi:superfamily II DNA/RNA helicase
LPGKLVELLQNKTLDLSQVRFFILDEVVHCYKELVYEQITLLLFICD